MAKVRRDVWQCDAPLCPVEKVDDGEAPDGYSGKVSTEGGSGVVNEPWYACSKDHIEPAITWVTETAHRKAWE